MLPKSVLQFKKKLNKRVLFFAFLFIVSQSISYFNSKFITIPIELIKIINNIIFVLVTFLFVSVFLRFTSKKVYNSFKDELEIEQRIFMSKLYSLLVYAIGIAVILWRLGVSIGNITLFLGLVTTGVAFAVRDVLMSIFAWFVVLTKKPFRMHDHVKIGDESGEVTRIGTFYITLKPADNHHAIRVPNKLLLEKPLRNYFKEQETVLTIPILSPEPCAKVLQKITNILKKSGFDSSIDISNNITTWFLTIYIQHYVDVTQKNKILFDIIHLLGSNVKKSKE